MSDKEKDGAVQKLFESFSIDSGLTLFGRIISKTLRFLFQALLTRNLSPSAYGAYAVGWTVIRLLREVSTAGMRRLVFKFGGTAIGENRPDRMKAILTTAVTITISLGVVTGSALFFLADWVAVSLFSDPSATFIIRWLAPSLPLFTVFFIVTAGLRVIDQADKYVLTEQLLQPALVVSITGVVFVGGYRLGGVAIAVFTATAIALLASLFYLVRNIPFDWNETTATYAQWRSYFSFSGVAFFLGLSVLLMNSIDRLMLGYLDDSATVGLYNVAATVGGITSLILGVTNSIFPPIISRLHSQEKHDQLKAVFQTQSRWVFALTLPIYAIFVVFGRELLSFFGPSYVTGYSVLLIVALGHLINATTGSVGSLLSMTGFQNIEAGNYLVANILNLGLNAYLIPEYGATGAALATAIVIGLLHVVKSIQAYVLVGIQPFTYLHFLVVAASIIGIGLYLPLVSLFPESLFGRIVASTVVLIAYAGLALFVEIKKGRIQILALSNR